MKTQKLKRIVLSLMMLACGSAISQKDTTIEKKILQKNDSLKLVCIDTSIARLVANDLVDGDVCKAEIKFVRKNLKLTQEKLFFKDSIIKGKDNQILLLKDININKDELLNIEKTKNEEYKIQLKREKRSVTFYKITTLLSLLTAGAIAVLR